MGKTSAEKEQGKKSPVHQRDPKSNKNETALNNSDLLMINVNAGQTLQEHESNKENLYNYFRTINQEHSHTDLSKAYYTLDSRYRIVAEQYEYRLAKVIEKDPKVNEQADRLVGYIKQIFDAWLSATYSEEQREQAYKEGFHFSYNYYGDFEASINNIRNILDNASSQPLRLKYGLIYKCTRGGGLTIWLKALAVQHHKAERAMAQMDMENRSLENVSDEDLEVKLAGQGKANDTVNASFYRSLQGNVADVIGSENLEKMYHLETNPNIPKLINDDGTEKLDISKTALFSTFDPLLSQGMLRIRHGTQRDKLVNNRRFLNRSDVDDLTSAEAELLAKRSIKPGFGGGSGRSGNLQFNPAHASKVQELSAQIMDKKQGDAKIKWQQGSEDATLVNGTVVTQEANRIKARMEAGVSGSTAIMLTTMEMFRLNDEERRIFRLGLAGWMVAARDHSFYEVFRSAHSLGVPFRIHDGFIGGEYQDESNLYPVNPDDARSKAGFNNQFPSYFYSRAYLDVILENQIAAKKGKDEFKLSLKRVKDPNNKNKTYKSFVIEQPAYLAKLGIEDLFPEDEHKEYNILSVIPYFEGLYKQIKELTSKIKVEPNPDPTSKDPSSRIKNSGEVIHTYWELKRSIDYVELSNRLDFQGFSKVFYRMIKKFTKRDLLKFLVDEEVEIYQKNNPSISRDWENSKILDNLTNQLKERLSPKTAFELRNACELYKGDYGKIALSKRFDQLAITYQQDKSCVKWLYEALLGDRLYSNYLFGFLDLKFTDSQEQTWVREMAAEKNKKIQEIADQLLQKPRGLKRTIAYQLRRECNNEKNLLNEPFERLKKAFDDAGHMEYSEWLREALFGEQSKADALFVNLEGDWVDYEEQLEPLTNQLLAVLRATTAARLRRAGSNNPDSLNKSYYILIQKYKDLQIQNWIYQALFGDVTYANWLFANLHRADFIDKSGIDTSNLTVTMMPEDKRFDPSRSKSAISTNISSMTKVSDTNKSKLIPSNKNSQPTEPGHTNTAASELRSEEFLEKFGSMLLPDETELIQRENQPSDTVLVSKFIENTFFNKKQFTEDVYKMRCNFLKKHEMLSDE